MLRCIHSIELSMSTNLSNHDYTLNRYKHATANELSLYLSTF